ncbi:MAG: hypothetical protein ACRDB0_06530 [Paraclostridium sp.]
MINVIILTWATLAIMTLLVLKHGSCEGKELEEELELELRLSKYRGR